ncbi:MAG: hypothetical protein ACFE7A_03880 [Promethearchaeota archaeon]
MKLWELSKKVISYLKSQEEPKSPLEIAKSIGIPLTKKRRIYDVLDVLKAIEIIKIKRSGNETNILWTGIPSSLSVNQNIESQDKEREMCIVNVDVIFPSTDYKTLKNETWQSMMRRDLKRNIPAIVDVTVNEVRLEIGKKKEIAQASLPVVV